MERSGTVECSSMLRLWRKREMLGGRTEADQKARIWMT